VIASVRVCMVDGLVVDDVCSCSCRTYLSSGLTSASLSHCKYCVVPLAVGLARTV